MASGGRGNGFSLSKLPPSDPRPSRGWQRSSTNSDDQNDAERDVNSSHKNVPKEVRINNWDFADWRPNSASTDSKRRKKSKGNPEREREQSLSLDSPPQRDKKPRTPSTFPRTKMGPATPTSQKRALENLRSRMTFSETDDASTDGEPNNERGLPVNRKHPLPNYTRQDTLTTLEGATPNRNNNREESISDLDSNQIVGRLMQIRDYIKQANTMRETLHKSKEATNKDDMDKLKKLVDNLKEQEGGYMGLLQRMLALRDDSIVENGNGFLHAVLPDEEDDVDIKSQSDDTVSVDLEVQTNASDTTTEERTNSSSSRPYIEDKLGDTEEEEEEGVGRGGQRSKESTNMDNTLVAQRNTQTAEWDFGTDVLQSEEVPTPSQIDSMRTNELAALQQQQNLLKILAEKQEQLRALQGRQDALKAMHQEAEQKLAIAQTKENKAKSSILAVSDVVRRVNNSQSGDGPVDSTTAASQMEQLMSLQNRLEMLKNASVQLDEEEERSNHDNETSVDDDTGRRQLQDKLEDLQSKKDRMDDLLKELQALRSQRFEALLQGEGEDAVTAAPVVSGQVIESLEQVDGTADSTEQVLSMMDAHNKLEKLQEVKQRLDQLRGLVQYYQSAKHDGESVDCVDQSSVPGYSDYGEGEATDNTQRVAMETMYQSVVGPQTRLNPLGAVCDPPAPPVAPPQQSDEENASSNNGSQESSLGPWGDEPEIREKVRQLKATKEKLQQLQDLVAMVQESPEVVPSLPDNVGVGEEEGDVRNIPVPLVEVPTHDNTSEKSGIVGGESLLTVKDQIKELSELKEERERLLHIQNQLKSLHSHFDGEEEGEEREERERKKRGSSEPGPVVTFASNDELYSKMRKQRMLREELRSKKKELEAIMKKDRNKRQYFKNQDNQSDTVSYSTDAFGASASADVTMATWGGSTVDNLENITESRNGGEEEEEYLSDGIVQVEEEEEEESDNNTYTIEGDAKQRQASRNKPSSSSLDVRPKVRKPDSFPRSHTARHDVNRGPRVKVEKKEMVRKTRLQKKSRQQNYRSPEDIVRDEETTDSSRLDTIQQQLERTLELLQHSQTNPLHQPAPSPNTSGLSGNVRPGIYPTDLIQQQIQQQQMMMSMNHFHQQLSLQQLEMRTLQQNIHQINQYIINSSTPPTTTDINPLASSSSIPLSPSQPPFPSLTPPSSSFNFNPRFPPSFSQSNTRPADLDSALRSPSRPDTSRNNLRPVPSSRVDSYDQNTNLNNYLSRERDVRPKVQDYRRSRRGKESQSSSPRDDIERGEGRRGRQRFDESSLGGAFTSRINRNRGNDGSEMSLFETLRETIYAEVATLISRNESRPHFLLEIIRELQNLSTDYLRQRGLYTLQELVAKTLSTDDPSYTVMATRWTKTDKDNLTASDLTPSESCLTSDDEEVRGRMEKTKKLEHQGSLKNNEFDYTEQVENTSSLSTPSTGLMESPFANESLGDTVIHLDKALERMRQMERNDEDGGGGGQINPQSIEIVYNRVREARQAARSCDHPSTSCLSDQSSPYTTVPDLMYGRVNSKHLDVEVKQIITEVVPVIREHVDDVCSPQLLSYVKRLILSLTRQRDSRKQFTPFFHQQLGSILHDSLTRFEGRKVRECSDDLLNDMSDALYDELAFFRMMQDLNQPPANVKTAKIKTSSPHHSPVNHRKQPINEDNNSSDDGHQLNIETTGEDDDLGKERDDELASETIQDGDDKDQETESPYKTSGMKIELAVSETKPFTRIGSDEDDEDSDESHSAEDPSETAVSRDAKMSQSQDAPRPTSEGVATSTSPLKPDADKDEEEEEEEKKDGDDDHPAAVVNGDKDDEEVKIDDLPTSLNIHTTNDIKEKMKEEELSTGGVASVLSIIDVPVELAGDGNHLPNPDEFGK